MGEQHHWDFERYINIQRKQQHSIMEDLVEHRYTGIDPCSKVSLLRDGIKKYKFDAVQTGIIVSDERLCSDFDACITLYQDYIHQTSNLKIPQWPYLKWRHTVLNTRQAQLRHITTPIKEEFNKLSHQKHEVTSKCLKHGHKPGANDKKGKWTLSHVVATGNKDMIKDLVKAMMIKDLVKAMK